MEGDSLSRFNGLPLTVRYAIDQSCTRFETAWRSGEAPALESYLVDVAVDHQAALLSELLALDLEYRRERGESPRPEEYDSRLPDFADIVHEIFAFADPVPVATSLPDSPSGSDWPTIRGFEVLAELGRGGMGVVYKARQLSLSRLVALKMLHARGPSDLEDRVRFRLEAEAVAHLHHPHIVQVYESGEHQGHPYLVLELVEGGALSQLVGQPLSPRTVAEIIESLARAIHHAHSRGVVHRDLKPANVLLDRGNAGDAIGPPSGHGSFKMGSGSKGKPDPAAAPRPASGEISVIRSRADSSPKTEDIPGVAAVVPKITDFGLAKRLEFDSWQTREGHVLGTPAYMAPEQAAGDRSQVGPPTDVYALGVILYQLLTGRVPLEGKDGFETLMLVQLQAPPAIRRARPDVSTDLETICLKCLQKEPSQRYATAQDLASDLRRFLTDEPIQARPVSAGERARKWIRRNPTLAVLLVAVSLLMVTVATISTSAALRFRRDRTTLLEERGRTRLAEERRKITLVDALLTAAPESVPYILDMLSESRELAVLLLRQQAERSRQDATRRLRAAVALTVLGDPKTTELLDAVPSALAAEGSTLALAFRALPASQVVPLLLRRAGDAANLTIQARYAILLLDLGDLSATQAMLDPAANPGPRHTLMELFPSWHGDLAVLPNLLLRSEDEACRSGLCAAVGGVDPGTLAPEVRGRLAAALGNLYQNAPDGGTHSAAEWALRRWDIPLPALESSVAPVGGRRWFVNRTGLTMVGLAPGAFALETDRKPSPPIVLTRSYFLGSAEVSVALFRRFVDDPRYPAWEKPSRWPGPLAGVSPENDCPVNNVSRGSMILFCNWLSHQEDRPPCYRRTGLFSSPENWTCDFQAKGYRLPTEAEWDYAHRAGSATLFFFGDEARWFPNFAHVASVRTMPVGTRLPNRWGLFDMVGNVWEMCWDHEGKRITDIAFDPRGPAQGSDWIWRGGGFDSGSYDCRSSHSFHGVGPRDSLGFRVACGAADALENGGVREEVQREIEACTRGLDSMTDNPSLLRARGELAVRLGRWESAAADYRRLADLEPNDPTPWCNAATLLLLAGDEPGYRRLRQEMLDRFGNNANPLTAEQIAKSCLLMSLSADGLARAVKLIESAAVSTRRPAWASSYFELTRGLAAYRGGDWRVSLNRLTRSQSLKDQPMNRPAQALAAVLESVAHRRLNQAEAASAALTRGQSLVAKDLVDLAGGALVDDWPDLLIYQVILREASRDRRSDD